MKTFISTALLLLGIPLQSSCQQVAVTELGDKPKVLQDGNSVSWMVPDQPGRVKLSCDPEDGEHLVISADDRYATCCSVGQALKGPRGAAFACCGGGHDIAGSATVGYLCCPEGQDFDGVVCK